MVDASNDTVDTLDTRYRTIRVADLSLKEIIRVNGGRLVVHKLPDYPPLECKWGDDECDELADYFIILVSWDEEDFVNQLCKHHFEVSKEHIFKMPTDVLQ